MDLRGRLEAAGRERLRRRLVQALADGRAVAFAAAEGAGCDTATLQLLYAFARDAGERDVEFRWRGAPDGLAACARELGLRGALRLPNAGDGD